MLLRNDCLARANASASTAVDALISVDYIDIALRDSLYGALTDAGTACYASVSNFVSHSFRVLELLLCVMCMQIYKLI